MRRLRPAGCSTIGQRGRGANVGCSVALEDEALVARRAERDYGLYIRDDTLWLSEPRVDLREVEGPASSPLRAWMDASQSKLSCAFSITARTHHKRGRRGGMLRNRRDLVKCVRVVGRGRMVMRTRWSKRLSDGESVQSLRKYCLRVPLAQRAGSQPDAWRVQPSCRVIVAERRA